MADLVAQNIVATKTGLRSAVEVDQHVVATFCFVDIAGYSALTEAHGETAAADLVDGFTRLIHSAVGSHGTVQEISGDNAFLVFPTSDEAVQYIAALYRLVADLRGFPMLRTGLHHGSALCRRGRYFGSTINIAARTAAQARAGEVLCTSTVVHGIAATSARQHTVHPVGMAKLKNIPQRFELYRIELRNASQRYLSDPVCQMQVDPRSAAAHHWFDGRQYWFCSADCARSFAKSPLSFV